MTPEQFNDKVKAEAARYGFTNFPLTDNQLRDAFYSGVSADAMYGVVCDVNAGVAFETALQTAMGRATQVKTVDVTPTWAALIPLFRAVIEDGSASSQAAMWNEIERMARLLDMYVEADRRAAVREEVV